MVVTISTYTRNYNGIQQQEKIFARAEELSYKWNGRLITLFFLQTCAWFSFASGGGGGDGGDGDSGLHEAARPPLTKHDPGFNFIDRKKSLAILDYVDLAYIDIQLHGTVSKKREFSSKSLLNLQYIGCRKFRQACLLPE